MPAAPTLSLSVPSEGGRQRLPRTVPAAVAMAGSIVATVPVQGQLRRTKGSGALLCPASRGGRHTGSTLSARTADVSDTSGRRCGTPRASALGSESLKPRADREGVQLGEERYLFISCFPPFFPVSSRDRLPEWRWCLG